MISSIKPSIPSTFHHFFVKCFKLCSVTVRSLEHLFSSTVFCPRLNEIFDYLYPSVGWSVVECFHGFPSFSFKQHAGAPSNGLVRWTAQIPLISDKIIFLLGWGARFRKWKLFATFSANVVWRRNGHIFQTCNTLFIRILEIKHSKKEPAFYLIFKQVVPKKLLIKIKGSSGSPFICGEAV